jgi:hypothetical protein
MLGGTLALRDVPDVEGLCRGVLDEVCRREKVVLEDADFDEALAFLLGEIVIVERRFDPTRGVPFRPYAYGTLRFRLIDFFRSFYGRSGQHRVLAEGEGALVEDGDDGDRRAAPGRGDRLDGAHARGAGDGADDGSLAYRRLLESRDRTLLREVRRLGLRPPGPAAGRDRSAGRRQDEGALLVGSGPWLDCPACGWRSYLAAPNGKPGWTAPADCVGCGAELEPIARAS